MSFKDFFNRYKVLAFIIYALALSILLLVLKTFWVKLVFVLPLFALGGYIIYQNYRRAAGRLTAVKTDGGGEIQITQNAVIRAVHNACKEIEDIKYAGSEAKRGEDGVHVKVFIKIIKAKLIEASETTRELIKELVEYELGIKIDKVDIIVINTTHTLNVKKLTNGESGDEGKRIERRAVYDENSPSYLLHYGSEKKIYKVPSNYVEEEVAIETTETEQTFLGEE